MASSIALKTLPTGVEFLQTPNGLALGSSRQVFVYARGTTTPVPVYSNAALTVPLTQPLTTGADGTAGAIPGFVAAGQAIDFFDVASGALTQAEPLAIADLIGSDGLIGGPGARGFSIPLSAPVNTIPPTISGAVVQGGVLTANPGTWNKTSTFSYQWFQDPGAVAGILLDTTGPAYTPQATDVGLQLYVQVTATSATGQVSLPATSIDTAPVTTAALPVPVNTTLPSITGTAQAGQTLTAVTGSWSNTPTSYRYQWANDAGPLAATGTTYVVQGSDVGHTINLTVWATNANGEGQQATSVPTASVIAAAGTAPVNTGALPAISGTVQVGQGLSVTSGVWSNSPTSYAYQWKWFTSAGQAGTTIAGATLSTYAPVAADVGHQLYVAVTAINATGQQGYAYTTNTVAVIASTGGGSLLWAPTFTIGTAPVKGSVTEFASLGSSWVGSDITCVTDPLGSGLAVYKYAVANADRPSTNKPRADLLSGYALTSGQFAYMSIPIYLPYGVGGVNTSIPLFGTGGSNFNQWAEVKDTAWNNPTWGVGLQGIGGIQCHTWRAYTGTVIHIPANDNAWHCLVLAGNWHYQASTNWGADGKGYFMMWWDGVQVNFTGISGSSADGTKLNFPTVGGTGGTTGSVTAPQPLDINSYRAADFYTGTLTTYHGRPKIGTSLASVLPDSGLATGP